jgi:hypothetical protein
MMKATVLGSMLVLAACVEQPAIEHAESDLHPAGASVPIVNALTPSQLLHATLNANTLDDANRRAMARTADSRTALSYAIGCALSPGHDLEVVVDRVAHPLPGALGLADTWTKAPLTLEQRRLVTSCMLARLNYYGISVNVSLRGASPELEVNDADLDTYTIEEGAFFGDVFAGAKSYAGVCSGSGTAPWQRKCAQPGPSGVGLCEVDYVGACGKICGQENGYYVDCAGRNDARYAEVITAYLRP